MRMANLSEVKDKLSQFVAQVQSGETVRILVHGRAAADLVPVARQEGWDEEPELSELERLRIVRRSDLPPDDALLRERPIVPRGGKAASDVLIDERRRDR